jgi:hypothetical protein
MWRASAYRLPAGMRGTLRRRRTTGGSHCTLEVLNFLLPGKVERSAVLLSRCAEAGLMGRL